MRELVFLLEEESAAALLETFLPRILLDGVMVRTIVFEGKSDLAQNAARKIRAYRNPRARFLILTDQDRTPDCREVKRRFLEKCRESGQAEKCVVRIACRELETFYLADLEAVATALDCPHVRGKQDQRTYRTPDSLAGPSVLLAQLTRNRYRKVSGSREIGRFLDPANRRSASFRNFVEAIRRLQEELLATG